MPESFDAEYIPIPDDAGFTRSPIRAGNLMRAVQANLQHLWGTRAVRLLADESIWAQVAITPAFTTEPVWHVTVPPGVTTLLGTAIWVAVHRNDGGGLHAGDSIDVRFRSERGGAGVAAGLDVVASATVHDETRGEDRRSPGSAYDGLQVFDGEDSGLVTFAPWRARTLGGAGGERWIPWTPDLSTSREQRIACEVSGFRASTYLWAVHVFGVVPAGA